MTLTLLLDLDDTLLDTNMEAFVPAYFQALAAHLNGWVEPKIMLSALMSGTQLMLANDDPRRTLQEVFESDFYPKLEVDKEKLRAVVEDFYDNVFRTLSAVTHRRAGATELVDWAFAQGYRVAIATDPLFPRKAIFERIRWAGLDPERFELVSSFETFHFTKSQPAYFAEVLGRLGWPDGPVLMVGNDMARDLAPAQQIGLSTYQVDGLAAEAADVGRPKGNLVDLRRWLDATDLLALEPSWKGWPATMAILSATPAVLESLTAGLTPEAWAHEPNAEEWAMIELICHLRDTEVEVHQTQLTSMLNEVQPFVPRPDAAVWAKQRKYLDEDGPRALAQFTAARMGTLRRLNALEPEVWEKPARHAIFGPTNFGEVVGFMADHDRLHIQQAWNTLKAGISNEH